MSDKFKVIDHATFERMQQTSSSKSASHVITKIRNSKYKRMAATNFNLMQFVHSKQTAKKLGKKRKIRKRITDSRIIVTKHRGKKRENGIRKKPSRLKKSILQYRQKKREQAQNEDPFLKLGKEFLAMKVGVDPENENRLTPHSSSFREYCNCCKTSDLKKFCEQLLRELNFFQRRAYAQNDIKARAHKRFVIGFRQVQANLNINKVKLIIIATDCERNEGEISLNDTIEKIKNICTDRNIPIAFAFRRREMAYILYKRASISCVGILDYDGARDIFSNLIEALKSSRALYDSLALNKKKC